MNTDGNTDAINRHIDELEAHFDKQDAEAELQELRDEVDALAVKLAEVEAERDDLVGGQMLNRCAVHNAQVRAEAYEAMLPAAYRAGVEAKP